MSCWRFGAPTSQPGMDFAAPGMGPGEEQRLCAVLCYKNGDDGPSESRFLLHMQTYVGLRWSSLNTFTSQMYPPFAFWSRVIA
jgi:hypothetical protein